MQQCPLDRLRCVPFPTWPPPPHLVHPARPGPAAACAADRRHAHRCPIGRPGAWSRPL